MLSVSLLAAAALGIAAVSFWRLSRLPPPAVVVDERTFANLAEGDVVLAPEGDFLVASREALGEGAARADLFALRSGRDRRWLLARSEGPLALLPLKPETSDVDRAVAVHGGKKLERATVDLLPGGGLPASAGRA